MAFIDGSALTVALPKLRASFGADLASVQWVLNGYVLALAALTLIGGALADVYGKARMLAVGCIGFGLASAACVVAPSVGWLIALRVVQGVVGRDSDAGEPGADRRELSEGGTQCRDRRLGGGLRAHHRRRSGAGRLADRELRLAMGIRDQSAAGARRRRCCSVYAPPDRRAARRFDLTGAAILAVALGLIGLGVEPDRAGRSRVGERCYGGRRLVARARRAWPATHSGSAPARIP